MTKKEVIERFLSRNYLVSPDFLDSYDGNDDLLENIEKKDGLLILNIQCK